MTTAAGSPAPALRNLAVAVLVALLVAHTAVSDGPWGDATYLAAVTGAALVAWVGVARWSGDGRTRGVLIAVGLTANAVAEWWWLAHLWVTGVEPDVSGADLFWLLAYLALFAALLHPRRKGLADWYADRDGVIDVGIVIIVATLLAWPYAIGPAFQERSVSASVQAVWAAYPVLDAILIALVLRLVTSRQTRRDAGLLLLAGAASWLLADYGFMFAATAGPLAVWFDDAWMLGACLLGTAAWEHRRSGPVMVVADDRHIGALRLGLGFFPLLIPGTIEVVEHLRGNDPNPVPLLASSAALVVLGLLRAVRLARSADRSAERLEQRERFFRTVAECASDELIVVDREGRILDDAGHPGDRPRRVGAPARSLIDPASIVDASAAFARALASPGRAVEVDVLGDARGHPGHWYRARVVNLLDDPAVGGVVVNLHDITTSRALSAQLEHQALHDALTGLPNRALLRDRTDHALKRDARLGLGTALVYLDLDGFKRINDSFGHEAGDEVLKEVARRISSVVRKSDTVARLGGDEFAIVIDGSRRALDEAGTIADRIGRVLTSPIRVDRHDVVVTASLGIANGTSRSASDLLRHADIAMYQAKATGRGRTVVYDRSMSATAGERLQLESDLVGALERGELRLVYQPVVSLVTEGLVGFEALLRWDHPTRGVVGPDSFIPILEDNGQIVAVGRWVLDQACATLVRWLRDYPAERPLTMAVNLSAHQLSRPEITDDVAGALTRTGLDPSSLVLELTESVLVSDSVATASRLQELRALGLRVAIDDFGTGYSSMSYLRQFPVDILKIDRSFVSSIDQSGSVPALVHGLIALAQTLAIEIVAEGVEEEVQRDCLRDEGCGYAQGYLFSKPLDEMDAEVLLMQGSTRRWGDDGTPAVEAVDGGAPW